MEDVVIKLFAKPVQVAPRGAVEDEVAVGDAHAADHARIDGEVRLDDACARRFSSPATMASFWAGSSG